MIIWGFPSICNLESPHFIINSVLTLILQVELEIPEMCNSCQVLDPELCSWCSPLRVSLTTKYDQQ